MRADYQPVTQQLWEHSKPTASVWTFSLSVSSRTSRRDHNAVNIKRPQTCNKRVS